MSRILSGGGVSQHALGQTPPRKTSPRQTPPSPEGHCSGRYASYWNAFLLVLLLGIQTGRTWMVPTNYSEFWVVSRTWEMTPPPSPPSIVMPLIICYTICCINLHVVLCAWLQGLPFMHKSAGLMAIIIIVLSEIQCAVCALNQWETMISRLPAVSRDAAMWVSGTTFLPMIAMTYNQFSRASPFLHKNEATFW